MTQFFSTKAKPAFSASKSGETRQGFGGEIYNRWLKTMTSTHDTPPLEGGTDLEQELERILTQLDGLDLIKNRELYNKIKTLVAKAQEEEGLKEVKKLDPLLDLDPIDPKLTKVQLQAIREVRHWSRVNGGKPFYCFRTVNSHQKYRGGDSLHERLGVSERTLRTHLKKVCKKYESYKAYCDAENKFEGLPLLSYFDRVNRITYFLFNPDYEPQFSWNYFKKRSSKNRKVKSKVTERSVQNFAGRFADPTYKQNTQNNLLLKCSFTDQNPKLDKQEEEDFNSCENKDSFSVGKNETDINTALACKERGVLDEDGDKTSEILCSKKEKERKRRDRQRQANHKTRKSNKEKTSKSKNKESKLDFETREVRHLHRIYEEVTGTRQNPITDPEKIKAIYKAFVEDFQGDKQRFRCYAQSITTSDFLMRRNSSSTFIAWFGWAMKKENIQKVWSGTKYQLQKLYHDLVEAWSNSVEAIQTRIRSLKVASEVKNLRLRLLERFGREVYVSWFEPLKICLEGGIAVFKANNEFVKAKIEEKCGQALKRACGSLGLISEIVVGG